jgi:hemerythrin-like domain-containing protein
MTTATQNLENDHVQILRLIEVIESITKSEKPTVEHLELVVKIIREFADGLHHAKEENFLFPLMVKKGYSTESGPVAVMLHDHAEGRNYVKAMIANIELYKQGEPGALNKVYSNMAGYADLLKNHIHKENNVLFRMADNAFSSSEQETLLNEFSKVENTRENGFTKDGYISMISELASAYLA